MKNILALFFSAVMFLSLFGCEIEPVETFYTVSGTYDEEFESCAFLHFEPGEEKICSISDKDWGTVKTMLVTSCAQRHEWAKSEVESFLLGQGLSPSDASEKAGTLCSMEHGFWARHVGSGITCVVK